MVTSSKEPLKSLSWEVYVHSTEQNISCNPIHPNHHLEMKFGQPIGLFYLSKPTWPSALNISLCICPKQSYPVWGKVVVDVWGSLLSDACWAHGWQGHGALYREAPESKSGPQPKDTRQGRGKAVRCWGRPNGEYFREAKEVRGETTGRQSLYNTT